MRTLLLLIFSVLVLSAAIVSGFRDPASEGSASSRADLVAGRADARCPQTISLGSRAPEGAIAAARHHVRDRVKAKEARGYKIVDVISLAFVYEGLPRRTRKPYRAVAVEACGTHVAARSMVVFIHFPSAPMASLVPAAFYVARTAAGWRVWYRYYPNSGTREFVP